RVRRDAPSLRLGHRERAGAVAAALRREPAPGGDVAVTPSHQPGRVAVIGGSGFYDFPGLEQREEVEVETPFGRPSDAIVTGLLAGRPVAFLARHGRGHRLSPTEI